MDTSRHALVQRSSAKHHWLKCVIVFTLLAFAPVAHSQGESPCCGPISPDSRQLLAFLDSLQVEQHWPAGWHVNWRTGEPVHQTEKPTSYCSAFAAAAAHRLGIYLLRPPEHPQVLLANAQFDWLQSQGAE